MAVNRDWKEKKAERGKKEEVRDSKYDYYAKEKPSEHAEKFFRRPAYGGRAEKSDE